MKYFILATVIAITIVGCTLADSMSHIIEKHNNETAAIAGQL